MHAEGKKKKSSLFPSSSSFESLSTSDDVESGSSGFSPKYPSSSSSFHRKKMAGPRSPRFFVPEEVEGAHHFLRSCHLCKRPIGGGRDIFMYRGDTPFCSEECRQEQMEMDEANEKRAKPSKNQQQPSRGPTSPSKIHVRVTGTVVAG